MTDEYEVRPAAFMGEQVWIAVHQSKARQIACRLLHLLIFSFNPGFSVKKYVKQYGIESDPDLVYFNRGHLTLRDSPNTPSVVLHDGDVMLSSSVIEYKKHYAQRDVMLYTEMVQGYRDSIKSTVRQEKSWREMDVDSSEFWIADALDTRRKDTTAMSEWQNKLDAARKEYIELVKGCVDGETK